jgi:hypothetical protein
LHSFFYNINLVSQLDWSFDDSLNFDPVRDAVAHNAAAGISSSNTSTGGGGSSQPQGGNNPSGHPVSVDTDTTRLAHYLSAWEGQTVHDAGLQRFYPSYDPESREFPYNRT